MRDSADLIGLAPEQKGKKHGVNAEVKKRASSEVFVERPVVRVEFCKRTEIGFDVAYFAQDS